MNTGYLAAFATLFAWTISSFVLAKLSRLADPSILNKAVLFFSIFLLGSLVCILDHLTPWQLFTGANASNWFWLGLSGILGKSIGDYCGFCSYAYTRRQATKYDHYAGTRIYLIIRMDYFKRRNELAGNSSYASYHYFFIITH